MLNLLTRTLSGKSREDDPPPGPAPTPLAKPEARKVLIIEDDPVISLVYRTNFERAGFRVSLALDGKAGYFKVKQERPDIILVDLMLPHLNGVEIIKSVRADSQYDQVPVFVFTNVFLSDLAKEARKAGAAAVFDKAKISPKDVLAAINDFLNDAEDGARKPATTASSAEGPFPPAPAAQPPEVDASAVQSFLGQARESLANARKQLQSLAKNEDEALRSQALEELYRRVHLLASTASVARISAVADLCSALEALLKTLHERPKLMSPSIPRTISHTLDVLGILLDHQPQEAASPSCFNILVVEDEAISAKAIVGALDRAKLKAAHFSEPDAALKQAERNSFDLVCLDIGLPGMNGFELCSKLRAMPGYKNTPVIFITSANDFASRSRSILSGGNDFILKPFMMMELAVKALTYATKGRFIVAPAESPGRTLNITPAPRSAPAASTEPAPAEKRNGVPIKEAPPFQRNQTEGPKSIPEQAVTARQMPTPRPTPPVNLTTLSGETPDAAGSSAAKLVAPAVISLSPEWIIESISPVGASLFQWEPTEVVGKPIETLLPDVRKVHPIGEGAAHQRSAAPKNGTSHSLVVARRKDDSVFIVDFTVRESSVAGRRMLTCIIRDLTGEQKGDERLASLERRYQETAEELARTRTALQRPTANLRMAEDSAAESAKDKEKSASASPTQQGEVGLTEPGGDASAQRAADQREEAALRAKLTELEKRLDETAGQVRRVAGELQQETVLRKDAEQRATSLCTALEEKGRIFAQKEQEELILRQRHTELEQQVHTLASELTASKSNLQKQLAERQSLEAQVRQLDANINLLSAELTERRKGEDDLLRTHDELETRLQRAEAELGQTRSTLHQEVEARQSLEQQAAQLSPQDANLSQELQKRADSEANLRQAQHELETRVQTITAQLADAKTALQNQSRTRRESEQKVAELAAANANLGQQLAKSREHETTRRAAHAELENRVATACTELEQTRANLQREAATSRQLQKQASRLIPAVFDLLEELKRYNQTNLALRQERKELERHAQKVAVERDQARTNLEKELGLRLQLEQQTAELSEANRDLTAQLAKHENAETELRELCEDWESRCHSVPSQLSQSEAELGQARSTCQHLEQQAAALGQTVDGLRRELIAWKDEAASLRSNQAELDQRLTVTASDLDEAKQCLARETATRQELERQIQTLSQANQELSQRLASQEEAKAQTRQALVSGLQASTRELETAKRLAKKETLAREDLEKQAQSLAQVNQELSAELSRTREAEATAARTCHGLEQQVVQARTELEQTKLGLERATAQCTQVEGQAAAQSLTNAELERQLVQRTAAETALRQSLHEAEARLAANAGELEQARHALENEAATRRELERRAHALAVTQQELAADFLQRKASENQALQRCAELEKRTESANVELAEAKAAFRKQTGIQKRLEEQARKIESANARLRQELAGHEERESQQRATELAETQAALAREVAARKQLEQEAAKAKADLEHQTTQCQRLEQASASLTSRNTTLARELAERQQTEATLRDRLAELQTQVHADGEQLGHIRKALETEAAARTELERRATALHSTNEGLSLELARRTEAEAELRRAQAELEEQLQQRATELAETQAALVREVAARNQLEQEAVQASAAQAELSEELSQSRAAEAALRESCSKLEHSLQTSTAELTQAKAALAVELQARQRAEEVSTALTSRNMTLNHELAERQQTEAALRGRLAEVQCLENRLQKQAEELSEASAALNREVTTREQIEREVAKAIAGQAELANQLSQSRAAEAALRKTCAELERAADSHTAEQAQIKSALEAENQARQRAEQEVATVSAAKNELAARLALRLQYEATLLEHHAEFEARLAEHARALDEAKEALESETTARTDYEQKAAGLSATNGDLLRQLARRNATESLLARRCTGLEEQLKATAAELRSATTTLAEEAKHREEFEELARTASEANAGLRQEVAQNQQAQKRLNDSQRALQAQLSEAESTLERMAHELQQETRRREAVEQQDAALTQANATLANELSVVSQNYASAQEQLIQLQRKLEESLGTLTQTAAQLQQESQLRQAAEQRALTSAEANRDLGRQLIERLQVEADLRSLKDEAERQLQETSASLNWTTLELNKTVADRQEAQRQVETLDNTNTELSQQLLELARTDTGLRKAKGELERQLQQATETLAKATEALTKECAERERLEEAFQAARQEWCREREANRLEIASSGHALEIEVAGRQRIEADLARARYLALEEMRVKAESLDNLHGKVRAPLNSIFAVANRFLEVEITDPQRAGVESLLAGARDLADTLDELGRCLETKVGFETFVEQDLDPRDLAERLVDDLRGEAETKETDAASIVHQDVPAVLRGDPRRLREVLRHLLKHAIQVTDHGEVVLQVRRQREMNAVVLLRFEVRDTGNGLSAERRHGLASLVIEPDRVAARPLGSNEIPLAIAKLLVGMMGGEFGIDTTPAQGSVRWFTVPLAKPPTGMGSDSGARRCLNDWRVVVAGENQRRCRILSAQLTAAGARTALATSGVDAIASLRREALAGRRYDVAIINQELPDMNGLTLARLIKSDPAIAPTRLVMMSDPGAPVATDQLDIAGFEGRLRKPVRQSEVEACLASLLSGPGLPG